VDLYDTPTGADADKPSDTTEAADEAASDSHVETDLVVVDVAPADAPTEASSFDESAETPEPDCERQPWRRGCAGPTPTEADQQQQPVVSDTSADSGGVVVPQEIQDLLLAPVD